MHANNSAITYSFFLFVVFRFVGFKALRAYNSHSMMVTDLSCNGSELNITECDMTVDPTLLPAPPTLPAIHCFGE